MSSRRRFDRRRAQERFVGLLGVAVLALALLGPVEARGDGDAASIGAWTFRTRAVMSGSSTQSDPAGYKTYSGIAIEAAVGRAIHRHFAVELSIRTESREIDVNQGTPTDTRLGSLELLPINLIVQWHPLVGTFQPYLGAGVNATLCWEKSGALDDTQASPSVAPVVQAGIDIALTGTLSLNFDVRWNPLRTDLSRDGSRFATLKIDPLTLGAGIAIRL